jgi:hypothetical protein
MSLGGSGPKDAAGSPQQPHNHQQTGGGELAASDYRASKLPVEASARTSVTGGSVSRKAELRDPCRQNVSLAHRS